MLPAVSDAVRAAVPGATLVLQLYHSIITSQVAALNRAYGAGHAFQLGSISAHGDRDARVEQLRSALGRVALVYTTPDVLLHRDNGDVLSVLLEGARTEGIAEGSLLFQSANSQSLSRVSAESRQ